ncbi:sacsin-like protein [Labeo rohita]|uniref:Sacsin-like protein n=1 Tax=Labeo rohita TaxID=84645 RepID=A0A498NVH7_LABRO|nr:sacsin-like protein [Labeo rohita]
MKTASAEGCGTTGITGSLENKEGNTAICNFDLAGPVLYAFNDAAFTEEDWEGIQRVGRSIKQDDPTKVGRFGIGFNSVYHITGRNCVTEKHVLKQYHRFPSKWKKQGPNGL